MPRLLGVILFAELAVLLTGCATRSRVREIETRLDGIAVEIGAIRQRELAVTRELAPLIADLRITTTRLQDVEARVRDTAERIAVLNSRVTATESSLREAIAAVEALPRVEPAPPPERRRPPADSSGAADRAFGTALATFRSGELGQAVLELMEFIAKYPDHPLAPRAQLWIGEAYFRQRDYQQALVEYRKVVDTAPGSPSAAEAWLKIGQAYSMLRQRLAAASAWEHVVREHPGTEAADRARSLLRK